MCRAEDADFDLCRYFNYPCGGGGGGREAGGGAPKPRGEAMSKMDELI